MLPTRLRIREVPIGGVHRLPDPIQIELSIGRARQASRALRAQLRRNPRQRQNPGADPDTHGFLQWITIAHAFLAILLLLGDSHAFPAEPNGSLTRALVRSLRKSAITLFSRD